MSVFIGYPSFMAYQMMKGKKDNNDGFPSIPGMIARYSALGLTNEETESTSKNLLTIGYSGNTYTKIAFKNLAIYPKILSKEDCIKAYNYLQTLKAK